MHRATIEIAVVQNDIYSLEKDEVIGDLNNVVLILEQARACSRSRAVELAADMVRQRSEANLAFEHDLLSVCRVLGLRRGEREAVERYAVDGMRALVRGNYDWSERTGRYSHPTGWLWRAEPHCPALVPAAPPRQTVTFLSTA